MRPRTPAPKRTLPLTMIAATRLLAIAALALVGCQEATVIEPGPTAGWR